MPSKSQAQHNLMEMVAHNPAAAKRLKIPQSVGKEFVGADMKRATYMRYKRKRKEHDGRGY